MSDLPEPFTPPDCDLRGFDWMALLGARLFKSTFYRRSLKDPRGGLAGIKLWWEAMLQTPAGSLPADDEDLCLLADFGEDMKAWRAHRAVAMHGWTLCSDGRLYHRTVAEQVNNAWESRQRSRHRRETDAERLRRWRAEHGGGGNGPGNGVSNADETRFSDVSDGVSYERRNTDETRKRERETETRQERILKAPPLTPPRRGLREAGINPRAKGTNPRAAANNPRETGTNPRIRIRNPVVAEMLEGEENQAVIYNWTDYAWSAPQPEDDPKCLPNPKSSEAG